MPFYISLVIKALQKTLHFSHTLRSTSAAQQMQRLAVLVVDAGKTLHHGRVALLPGAGIGLESPLSLVFTWMAVMLPDSAILRTYSK